MKLKNSVHQLGAAALVAALATAGCAESGNSPARSTPLAASDASGAGFTPMQAQTDFARCLQGNGGAACFGAHAIAVSNLRDQANLVAPGAPGNFTATSSGSTVFLSWSAPSGDPAASYNIEAGSAPGLANLANFNTGNSLTSYSTGGVGAGTYYVRVRAVNGAGVSSPSNEVALVVGGATGGCAGPPSNLTPVAQSAGFISFSWSAPTTGAATSYVIEAGSAPGLSNLANFDTNSPATTFSANGIGAGSYYVRVRSRSTCGTSAPSNEILIFVVGFTGDVQVSVSWDAPSDVDLHVIEPSGEEIFYGNTVSSTGGQLDVDSNPACSIDGRQIENIRWGTRAPGGTYIVRVDYWTNCGVAQTNYLVTVKNGSLTQTFTGTFTGGGDNGFAGAGRTITSFIHAASLTTSTATTLLAPLFRAPQLSVPSAEKMRRAGATR